MKKGGLSEVQDAFWELVDKSEAAAEKAEANYSAEQHKVWDLVANNLHSLWFLFVHTALLKAGE